MNIKVLLAVLFIFALLQQQLAYAAPVMTSDELAEVILDAPVSHFKHMKVGENNSDFQVNFFGYYSIYTIGYNWKPQGVVIVRCCSPTTDFAPQATTTVIDSNHDGKVDCVVMAADVLQGDAAVCARGGAPVLMYGQMIYDDAMASVYIYIGRPPKALAPCARNAAHMSTATAKCAETFIALH